MLAQEDLGLGAELLEVPPAARPGSSTRSSGPMASSKSAKTTRRFCFSIEAGPGAQSAAHALKHWDGHVDPPLVGLHFLDQGHLRPDHRDGDFSSSKPGDLALTRSRSRSKAWRGSEQRQLQAEHEQVESLGLFGFRVQFGG